MRNVSLLIALVLFTSLPLLAQDDEPSPAEAKFDAWMSHYYLHKDTSEVGKYLELLQNEKLIEDNDSAAVPTSAFFSVIFAENPGKTKKWIKKTKFTGNMKSAIELALWSAGQQNLIEEISDDTPEFAEHPSTRLIDLKVSEAGDLDMMWGAFLASGDVVYVKKVIDVLDEDQNLSGDKKMDVAIRSAAEWSLRSNLRQHELIHRLVKNEIKKSTGTVKKKLTKMMKDFKKSLPSFPNKDGDFSAKILLLDEDGLDEFNKPSHEAMRFSELSKIRRGEFLSVKFVFAGMELQNDLKCNVNYDLKITDPDGKIYDESDLKNMEAMRQKLTTRFMIYDNASIVKIRFEPEDKPGKYRFEAKLHDRVGKKSISLTKEIEVIDSKSESESDE